MLLVYSKLCDLQVVNVFHVASYLSSVLACTCIVVGSDVVLETRVLVSRRLEDKNESLGLGLGLGS